MTTGNKSKVIAILIAMALGLAGCASSMRSSDALETLKPIKPSLEAQNWFPLGYDSWRSSSLAYKRIGGPCQLEKACSRWNIISKENCSKLHAAINVTHFEPFEATISYRKVLEPFTAGVPIILEFATYNQFSAIVSLEELECR